MSEPETIAVIQALSADPPTVLYHYTSIEGFLGIINSQSVWATNIHYLNDQQELHLTLDLAKACLEKMKSNEGTIHANLLRSIYEQLDQVRFIKIFVFSLSEECDLLSQWRSYSRGGGYSIGFATDGLKQICEQQRFQLARCIYKEKEQIRLILDLIRSFVAGSEDALAGKPTPSRDGIAKIARRFVLHLIQIAPLLKHISFAEEKEWRLISEPGGGHYLPVQHRVARGLLVPYCSLGLSTSPPISEVRVGPTPHPALAEESATEVIHAAGVKGCRYLRSDTPYRDW